MERDVAWKLAEFAANIEIEDLPASAIAGTKRDLFDSLATGLAGDTAKGLAEIIELAREWGGSEQATVFGFGCKFPAHVVARINTVIIHGYDFDDNHDTAMLHSGAVVVASALAAAEKIGGVSGSELLCALTAGLEIHIRLGLASTIGIVDSGWVFTPLMGIFAAVAAVGRVLRLMPEQIVSAFGIAYSQCAGTYQAITDSAWTKRIQPGFASDAAVVACEMAQKGIYGIQNTFEGKYGFYHNYLNNHYNPEPLKKGLGKEFIVDTMGFKPWPCGRPVHPSINVSIEAHRKFHPDPEQIEYVEIRMNQHLWSSGCTPEETRKYPKTIVDAQFSIPYTSACALIYGKVGLSDFTEEGIRRENVLKLAPRINGAVDEAYERNYHARVCPVDILIEMKDGTVYRHHVEHTLGGPQNPMSEDDFFEKMQGCLQFSSIEREADTACRLREMVNHLETLDNSNEIVKAMTGK